MSWGRVGASQFTSLGWPIQLSFSRPSFEGWTFAAWALGRSLLSSLLRCVQAAASIGFVSLPSFAQPFSLCKEVSKGSHNV